jgi:hypothetical protein
MNRTLTDCPLIQPLILKNQLEELTADETFRLKSHIQVCPGCRNLHFNLSKLHQSLAMAEADSPSPRPEIHLLLQQKMREIKSVNEKSGYTPAEIVLNILRHPVPLYQAAIVLLLTVCTAIYALNIFDKNFAESATVITNYPLKNDRPEQYINYFPDRVTLPQKVGVNVAEDTSFKSIRFSAL